jgi:hypothetical protein
VRKPPYAWADTSALSYASDPSDTKTASTITTVPPNKLLGRVSPLWCAQQTSIRYEIDRPKTTVITLINSPRLLLGITTNDDWHYPEEEPTESATMLLAMPTVISVSGASSAVLSNPSTKATATVAVGATVPTTVSIKGGSMRLVATHTATQITGPDAASSYAVIEWAGSARWSALVYLVADEQNIHQEDGSKQAAPLKIVRSPIGQLDQLKQPRYILENTSDPDWYCKQDIDPNDWLGKLAANASGEDGEATFAAAATVMAPNSENGLFGNPEVRVRRERDCRGGEQEVGGGARKAMRERGWLNGYGHEVLMGAL